MELWAAIDLLEGSAVTLVQGRAAERTVWSGDPDGFAARWEEEGADGLHLIDLDAAFGTGSNADAIGRIVARAGIPVQVGGGMRRVEVIEGWLSRGAARVVIGTLAYRDPSSLRDLLQKHGPDRFVVAADYRDGVVVTKGWRESQGMSLTDALAGLESMGVRNVLTTSVSSDGMGRGPDLATVRSVCGSTRMSVLASGGIRDRGDLAGLKEAGAAGAIIGKALYEGRVKLREAGRGLA